MQGKRWLFTLNNFTEEDLAWRDSLQGISSYGIVGKEVGESGTPHLQGYVIWNGNKRLAGCKKEHPGAHWELARGSSNQNRTYCSKGNDFVEWGVCPGDEGVAGGAATAEKWKVAREAAMRGDYDAIPDQIFVCHYGNICRIAARYVERMDDLPVDSVCGLWIVGETGSGKSHVARSCGGFYVKNVSKWWDGYRGEENVIIDDLDPSHNYLTYYLKIWLDRYAFQGEIKGGTMWCRPRRVIVTSQYPIEQVISLKTDQDAIKRRCTVVQWTKEMRGLNLFLKELPDLNTDIEIKE